MLETLLHFFERPHLALFHLFQAIGLLPNPEEVDRLQHRRQRLRLRHNGREPRLSKRKQPSFNQSSSFTTRSRSRQRRRALWQGASLGWLVVTRTSKFSSWTRTTS